MNLAKNVFFFIGINLVFATPLAATEITVSAAASLAEAFTELKAVFEAEHPGVTIHTNFGASNLLLRQIAEGAPVALFASADQATMDKAAPYIVPETRSTFAANGLVLITPADQTTINSLADLACAEHIAIGNPDSVPAGRYAREALTSAGLWDALAAKFVPGNSVRQVLDYVSRGEVSAGIVYSTDAKAAGSSVRIAATLQGHTSVTYPLALISPENPEALAFADFIINKNGQKILAGYGFKSK